MSVDKATYSELVLSLTSKLARMCGRVIEKPLEKQGVSLQEFRITGLLIGEQGINQKTLADMLFVKPATLSVAINKLESKGIIKRTVSETDKRVNYLSLCEGLDLSESNALILAVESQMHSGISKADIDTTRKTLNAMISNLEGGVA